MAKLLREFINLDYDRKIVQEASSLNQPVVIKGVLQRADAVNQNSRIYPRPILEREISNYQKAVMDSRAVGELDHPAETSISFKNASHIIREIGWQGNDVVGKVEVLNTPNGKILKSLMESGVKIGISSRGFGGVTEDQSGNDIVSEDFVLVCFDIVSEPSTHGAWLSESKNVNLRDVVKHLDKRDRVNRLANEILNSK